MNYFELFELPVQYQLDGHALSSVFRNLQRQYHPDNFVSASEQQQHQAVQKAAQINDAYRILKSPLLRAEYILTLVGFDTAGERTMQDTSFLIEQMTLREELETICDNNEPEQLPQFEAKVNNLYKEQTLQVQQLIEEKQWSKAFDSVQKLKFIDKLIYEIDQATQRSFDDF